MKYLGKLERKPKEEKESWKLRIFYKKRELERMLPGKKIVSIYMEDTAYFWRE